MKIKLKNVRLAFPDLFEAVEYEVGDGKPRYNATFLIEPGSANDKEIRAAQLAAVEEKYPGKGAAKLKAFAEDGATCYINGDRKEYDGYAGNWALSSHRQAKDGPVGVYGNVIDPQTGQVCVLARESGKPYAGCYVNATVDIYSTTGKNSGVWCGLIAVQFHKDGDSFGGASRASADDFEAAEGAEEGDIT